MTTQIIDGKKIAAKINNQTAKKVLGLKNKGIVPKLAVILVGNDKPSQTYINRKKEAAESIGIDFVLKSFPASITKDELIREIKKTQKDKKLSGLIVQLPLPENLYRSEVLNTIRPEIDVDCLTDYNLGKLVMETNIITPPTPAAVIRILKELKTNLKGKNITIIGMGALVGKPLAIILANAGASVTTCDRSTTNIKKKCLMADIIVTAVGKKDLLTGDMVRKGTVIIDTGICFVDHKMYGDVNFKTVSKKASAITPVPGGVGPITVSILLENTVRCAELNYEKN